MAPIRGTFGRHRAVDRELNPATSRTESLRPPRALSAELRLHGICTILTRGPLYSSIPYTNDGDPVTGEDVRALIRAEVARLDGSQTRLAHLMGITPQYICKILSGHTEVPHMGAVLDYFGLEAVLVYRKKCGP